MLILQLPDNRQIWLKHEYGASNSLRAYFLYVTLSPTDAYTLNIIDIHWFPFLRLYLQMKGVFPSEATFLYIAEILGYSSPLHTIQEELMS